MDLCRTNDEKLTFNGIIVNQKNQARNQQKDSNKQTPQRGHEILIRASEKKISEERNGCLVGGDFVVRDHLWFVDYQFEEDVEC